MSAEIIAFPYVSEGSAIGQNLRNAFPIKNAPEDLLDLFEACKTALDNLQDHRVLECLDRKLNRIA